MKNEKGKIKKAKELASDESLFVVSQQCNGLFEAFYYSRHLM